MRGSVECSVSLVVPEHPKLAAPMLAGLSVLLASAALALDSPVSGVLAAMGGGSLLLGSWYASSPRRLLSKASSIKDSWTCARAGLKPPKTIRVKTGVLEAIATLSPGGLGTPRLHTRFIEAADLGAVEVLRPLKLKDFGGIAGFHWTITWPESSELNPFPVEWLRVPAYSLEEPGYKGMLFKTLVIPLKPDSYNITPSRLELRASWNGVGARAEVEGGRGSISGYLELEGDRKGEARLYLELHKPPIKYWIILARLKGPGLQYFTWRAHPQTMVYGVLPLVKGSGVWPRSMAEALGSPQLLIGSAVKWINRAILRLAISTPIGVSAEDSADIEIK